MRGVHFGLYMGGMLERQEDGMGCGLYRDGKGWMGCGLYGGGLRQTRNGESVGGRLN